MKKKSIKLIMGALLAAPMILSGASVSEAAPVACMSIGSMSPSTNPNEIQWAMRKCTDEKHSVMNAFKSGNSNNSPNTQNTRQFSDSDEKWAESIRIMRESVEANPVNKVDVCTAMGNEWDEYGNCLPKGNAAGLANSDGNPNVPSPQEVCLNGGLKLDADGNCLIPLPNIDPDKLTIIY